MMLRLFVKNVKLIVIFIFEFTVIFKTVTCQTYVCPTQPTADWTQEGSYCFYDSTLGTLQLSDSWQNAETACNGLSPGTHLPYLFDSSTFSAFSTYRAISLASVQVWIGCYKSGSYLWSYNGTSVSWKPAGGGGWPKGGHTYCYSDTDASNTWQTDYSTASYQYICMCNAAIVINPTTITFNQYSFVISPGSSVTLGGPAFSGQDANTYYVWNFGDGTTTNTTQYTFSTTHTFITPGVYYVNVTVGNGVSGPFVVGTVTVKVVSSCIVKSCTVTPAIVNNPSEFTIVVNKGIGCSLTLDPKDGSAATGVGTYAGDASLCTSLLPGCGSTNGQWTTIYNYTYAVANTYTAVVSASNGVSMSNLTCTAAVQVVITGFSIIYPTTFNYYAYNTPVTVAYAATAGTGVTVTISIDSNSPVGWWSSTSLSGNVTLTNASINGVGPKTVTVQASNLVSTSPAVTYQFQVEYKFSGFQYTPNPAYISTTNTNSFQISWATASHFNCTVDFAGAAPLFTGYEYSQTILNANSWINAGVPKYASPGFFTIIVYAVNHVDSANYTINVTSQDPVCCVGLATDYVGILASSTGSSATASFAILWNDTTKPWPTNAQYDINFGVSPTSKLVGQTYLNQTNQTVQYTYTTSNAYTISVTVYNLVSSVTLTTMAYVVVKFVNPKFDMHRYLPYSGFEPHKYYLLTKEVAQFQMTLTDGTVFNMTIDFHDATPPYSTFQISATSLNYNRSFAQAGNYNVTMQLANVADYVMQTLPVPAPYPTFLVVQDPIQCYAAALAEGSSLVIMYATRSSGVTVHMQITTNTSCGNTGTNPRYIVDWGDGILDNGAIPNPNLTTTVPHVYNVSNIYNLKVTIWNEADSQIFPMTIQVYDEIASVSILARWVNTSNGNQESVGYYATATQAYFATTYPVAFHANMLFGTYQSYSWTWDDGYPATSNSTITRQFSQIGTYVLTLSITNQPTSGTFTFTAIIEVPTLNPNITDNSPFPIFSKPYQQYAISMDVVGTDSCYFLNLNDPPVQGTHSDCQIVIYGDQTMCKTFFPHYFPPPPGVCVDFTDLKSSYIESPASKNGSSGKVNAIGGLNGKYYINFTHQFATPGAHYVKFIVINHVFNQTMTYRTVVSKGWCHFPIVFVRDLNKCQSPDTCKCFFNGGPNYLCKNTASDMNNGNRVVYIKDQILADADVTINCSSSPNIWFNWTLYSLDLTVPGNVIANSTQLLNGLDYHSYHSKILVVPPHWLPGGRYNFTLTVSPVDEVDLDESDSTIIYVQASNLVAAFVGNTSGIHVPQNQKVSFDAYTKSYDPDFDQYNKTNLKWTFYCRRLCESWPTVLADQTYTNLAVFDTSTCTASDNAAKGCFTSIQPGGPMQLSGTGRKEWQLSTTPQGYTAGNITLDTSFMVSGVWYSLMVVLSKVNDSRVSYSELFFYVSPTTNVPSVTFNCVTNCQTSYSTLNNTNSGRYYNRVNPTSRFSIEAIIDGFSMATKYFYQWDLIDRANDKHNSTFSMKNVILVAPTEWEPNATTGRTIRTMSLQANWYGNNTSLLPGFFLRLTLWVNNMQNGQTGQYFYEFFLNNPPNPLSGQCFPNEQIGVALSPSYGIMCKGYVDSNNADLFYFVKQIDATNTNFWLDIGSSKTSMMPDYNIYVNAVPGSANSSYLTQFMVRVIDSSGSYIDVFTNGSVEPFDLNYPYDNEVWSILNYTATCSMCQYEDFYLQMTKIQRCVNVSAVVRTFSSMLNLKPSTGCLPVLCDNTTATETNCTVGEDIESTTMAPETVPPDVAILIDNAIGTSWMTHSSCRLDLALRINIREKLSSLFASLKIPYFSNFVVVVSALYPATLIPQENTIKIMQDVQSTLQEGVAHLDGVDPQLNVILEADVREEICKTVIGIVGNMEKTTNYYGAIWRNYLLQYYTSFSMDGLVSDIARLDAMVTAGMNVTYLTFQFDETNPMWQLPNNMSLDADTETQLKIVRYNITLITVVLNHIRNLKTNITDYVQARKVMAEAPSVLMTKNITSVYHKIPVKNMTSYPLEGHGGCHCVGGNAADMFGNLDALTEESVMGTVECAHNNPFTTDITSANLFGTVSLSFQNSAGAIPIGNLTKPIDVFVPRQQNTSSQLKPIWNTTQAFSKPMMVYSFSLPQYRGISFMLYEGWVDLPGNVTQKTNSTEETTITASTTTTTTKLTTTVTLGNGSEESEPSSGGSFVMFIKFWSMFDIDNKFHYYCVVPQWNDTDYDSSLRPTYGDPRTCTVNWNQALSYATQTENGQSATSINVYVAIRPIPHGYTINDFQNTTTLASYNDANFVQTDYTLFALVSDCMYYDEETKIWRFDGTDVGPNTTKDITHCRTTHTTSFSSSFSVPTNSLNLQDSAFLHLAENPIAFIFCLCLFCLYLILFVWCRRKDKEDLKKAGIAPLPDNDPRDRYLYQLVFFTASRPDAGTTADVYFQLTGETTATDVRLAKDAQRMAFRRNGIDTFIMAVPERLGKLTHLRIWHDNSGASPGWFLSRMQIMDVQTGEQFFFIVENWLAVEEGDGQVERIVPVAGKNDLTDFNQLFWQKSQKNLFDGHIWFSIFRRPPRSHFTRVQRLTCCLSLIYCTMVANILFYKTNTANASDIILSVGPITITWTSLKTGIYAALIVAPVNAILVLLFRYAKPIPIKSPMDEYLEKQKRIKEQEKRELKRLQKQKSKANGAPVANENVEQGQELSEMGQNQPGEPKSDVLESSQNLNESQRYLVDSSQKEHLEPPKVVHIDTRARKKKFWLPHWFIYVGYVLAFVTVAVAFWLIMQIAFGFGRAKALDWVIAMFVSLIQSIIFIQPIKIITLAIVYSCLCKKPEKDEYEPSEIELREDEVYVHDDLHTISDLKDNNKRLAILQKLQRTRHALPPALQLLQNARELRLKEIAMWALIREILLYSVFLYTLMMVAYGERNLLTYSMIQNTHNIFVTGSAYGSNSKVTKFTSIKKPDDFFHWAEEALLTGLFPMSQYNNQPLPTDQRYIYDGQGYLTGTVRLRQLRIKPNSCKIASVMKDVIHHCRAAYSVGAEDWGEYKAKWLPLDPTNPNDVADDLFTWKNMSGLEEEPFIGIMTTYWGGGFVADLGYERDSAAAILAKLKATDWLDAYTRAIFVEFNVFYPTINLLMISTMLVEFLAAGSTVVSPNLHALCLVPYSGPNAVPVIIGQVVCLLFLFYFIYKQIRLIMKEKLKYVFCFWNWLEIAVITMLFTALVMYIYRLNLRSSVVADYKANPNGFTNFFKVLTWEQVYSWMLYIVLFIANVKFLRLLRFNRRISVMVDTIRYGYRYVAAFFASFFLVFTAFACCAFFFFGSTQLDFMSYLNTLETLWVVTLNVFTMSDYKGSGPYGSLFFVVFTFTVNFILVNMFLSIVNDSFSVVKSQSLEQTNQYELIDFIWNKFKTVCGFAKNDVNGEGHPVYAEEQDIIERDLNDCHDKMELMFFRMEDYFKEEKIDEQMKKDWRFQSVQHGLPTTRHIVASE